GRLEFAVVARGDRRRLRGVEDDRVRAGRPGGAGAGEPAAALGPRLLDQLQLDPVHDRAPDLAVVLLLQPRAQGHARRPGAHRDRVPHGVVRRRLWLHRDVALVAAHRPLPVPDRGLARDEMTAAIVLWLDGAQDA